MIKGGINMPGVYFNGKLQEVEKLDTAQIKEELKSFDIQESEIQNSIDSHITEYLESIRRRM